MAVERSLVSLAPLWQLESRQRYQARHYARPPVVTHIAPNFMRLEAAILPALKLSARFWIMESRVAGGDFTLTNDGDAALDLQCDLFAHVIIGGRRRKLNVLTLADGELALHLGQIGNINPVATLEGAGHEIYGSSIRSPKLGCKLSIGPGESKRLRFSVAGLADMRDSLSLAQHWLARPWLPYFDKIDALAETAPRIQTGNEGWDQLIDVVLWHAVEIFHVASGRRGATGRRRLSRHQSGLEPARRWQRSLARLARRRPDPGLAAGGGGMHRAKAAGRCHARHEPDTDFRR